MVIVTGPRDITRDANRVSLRSVTRSSTPPARVVRSRHLLDGSALLPESEMVLREADGTVAALIDYGNVPE